eukprot:4564770-Pleurochrysis_carterae.AAC.1
MSKACDHYTTSLRLCSKKIRLMVLHSMYIYWTNIGAHTGHGHIALPNTTVHSRQSLQGAESSLLGTKSSAEHDVRADCDEGAGRDKPQTRVIGLYDYPMARALISSFPPDAEIARRPCRLTRAPLYQDWAEGDEAGGA